MTTPRFALLVGTHFSKPAPTLLSCLPNGARVSLRPEPLNPYDSSAVEVILLDLSQLNQEELESKEEELLGCGWSSFEVLAQSELKLGHVGRRDGKPMAKALRASPNRSIADNLDVLAGDLREGRLAFVGQDVWIELEASPS